MLKLLKGEEVGDDMIMPSSIARPIVPMKNVNVQKERRPKFWPDTGVTLRERPSGKDDGSSWSNLCF